MGNNHCPILVIGSIGMDLITSMKNIPKTGMIKRGNIKASPGGKGNLEAIACARAGGETAFIGVVGDDYCQKLKKNCEDNNVIPILRKLPNIESHIASILVGNNGINRMVINPGADEYFDRNTIDKNIDYIENSKINIFQLEIPLETVRYAIRVSYEKHKLIILRPSFILYDNSEEKVSLPEDILQKVNYLIANESELSTITDMPISNENEVESACKKLKNMGAQNLIIFLGNKGCILWKKNGDKKKYCSYYEEKDVVDSTGALDCFIGVLAAYLSRNTELDEAIKYANLATSICVGLNGTIDSFPRLDEINKKKATIKNW